MRKFFKTLAVFVLAFALILPSAYFFDKAADKQSEPIEESYISDLTSIYSKYDKDVKNTEEEYAFSRLIAYGWNGKTYGAVARAYDEANDFCVLQYSSPEKAEAAQKKMLADGVCAEPDGVAELDSVQKCSYSPEYSATLGTDSYLTNYSMAYDDVTVAVIDTGVMYDHTDIADRFVSNGVDLSSDEFDNAYYDTQERGDYYGHATFVSGIIANNTPDSVKLLPIKVVPFDSGSSTSSAIISGINYAVSQNVDVINVSLGAYLTPVAFQRAVNNALLKGICICASTGNDGEEITERYPACLDGVIAVSALNADCNAIANYSNYGEAVSFCAPGYRVYSTYPQSGQSGYKHWSGTSFSCPYIASLCADLKSLDVNLSWNDVYQTLCDFTTDLGDTGRDIYYGNGLPSIGNIVYSDNQNYEYNIPQGTLSVTGFADYTEDTQPWKLFASKLVNVSVDGEVERIGNYAFYNMSSAEFTLPQNLKSVGDYAFYGCSQLSEISFDTSVERIGYAAFGSINLFTIMGYDNTPAQTYALNEGINFVSLGCNHNYYYEVFEPIDDEPGYTVYTCSICGESTVGEYVSPVVVASGSCGANMTYTIYDTGKLYISGSGSMYDYTNTRAPWYQYRDSITVLDLNSDVQSINQFAFYGCNNIVKLYVNRHNGSFSTDGVSLFNYDKSELILTFARGNYTLPEQVDSLSAAALIAADRINLIPNSKMTVSGSVVYDKTGNVLLALPNYCGRTLNIETPLSINDYAFILCEYPVNVDCSVYDVSVGDYALGYTYNGELVKHALTVTACEGCGVALYAQQNGFTHMGGLYRCGENLTYTYDSEQGTLAIRGVGDMYAYDTAGEVPWYGVMSGIENVVISETVTGLSRYAFYNAQSLASLTMPLSLKAPVDNTVWYGCTNITTLDLTCGTGIMDDYIDGEGTMLSQYAPWSLSKTSIVSMNVDSNVKCIGKYAFYYCTALKTLHLNCIEKIDEGALSSCTKLKDLVIYSKNAELVDYCMLSYKGSVFKIYKGYKVSGYCDSTVKDYCDRLGAEFVPLGCGHSRNVIHNGITDNGTVLYDSYYCSDCESEYGTELERQPTLYGTLLSVGGSPVSGAEISVGNVSATTDENGEFILQGFENGNVAVSVSCNGVELFVKELTLSELITRVNITLRYADYVPDGVVNAKDYAYSLKNGLNVNAPFDYGKLQYGDNSITVVEE